MKKLMLKVKVNELVNNLQSPVVKLRVSFFSYWEDSRLYWENWGAYTTLFLFLHFFFVVVVMKRQFK